MLRVVLYDKIDADRFIKERPKSNCVLALTPDVCARLLGYDIPLMTSLSAYSDYSHRRVIARVKRMERNIISSVNLSPILNISSAKTLNGQLHLFSSFSARLFETLKGTGPWLIPQTKGWKAVEKIEDAHLLLFQHILNKNKNNFFQIKTTVWSFIIRLLNHGLLKSIGKKNTVLTTGNMYGIPSLTQKYCKEKAGNFSLKVSNSAGGFREVVKTLFNYLKIFSGGRQISYIAVPTYSKRKEDIVVRYLSCIKDPVIQRSIRLLKNEIIHNVVLVDGLFKDLCSVMKVVRPRAIWAHQLHWGCASVMGEAGLANNVPVLLISHGSHVTPKNITSRFELHELSKGMLFSNLSSHNILQSPAAKQAFDNYSKNLNFICTLPILWHYERLDQRIKTKTKRTILHAGTFKTYSATRPWIFETSDEFLMGLIDLVKAVDKLESTELIIRIRPAKECAIESMKKLLPKSDCYKIKTTGTLSEDLQYADLLVSYASTAIEEALYAHTPVLLWGAGGRYFHLPPKKIKPTKNCRSAVYAPENKESLIPMLDSILNCHADAPLTDLELKDLIWKGNFPSIEDIIRQPDLIDYINKNEIIKQLK